MHVVAITSERVASAIAFLERHTETALFLLSNLTTFGPAAGPHPYSGDFKAIVDSADRLIAVFCLTRSGVLLLDTHGRKDLGRIVFDHCEAAGLRAQAVIGERNAADSVWPLVTNQPGFVTSWESPENLFHLRLADASLKLTHDGRVRLLTPADFDMWNPVNLAYLEEVGMSLAGSTTERRRMFDTQASDGHWWGCVDGAGLVSTAAINVVYGTTAQVGAVYTAPDRRGKGLARLTLARLISDASARLGLTRLVLFTGETNQAARLYRSLGFEVVGKYGVYFGESQKEQEVR